MNPIENHEKQELLLVSIMLIFSDISHWTCFFPIRSIVNLYACVMCQMISGVPGTIPERLKMILASSQAHLGTQGVNVQNQLQIGGKTESTAEKHVFIHDKALGQHAISTKDPASWRLASAAFS